MTEQSNISLEKLMAGQFVIAMYDCDWYRGNEIEIALHDEDVHLDFLALKGPAQNISWPENSVGSYKQYYYGKLMIWYAQQAEYIVSINQK